MKKDIVLELMLKTKVIPLFYHADAEIAKKLITACYSGGARVIEFTNRGDQARKVFAKISTFCKSEYPELAIGVGSIVNTEQAQLFIDLGADFLVSPIIKESLAKFANERDILWSGGCGTITEMQTAYEWGAPLIKLFPGNIYGPAMIKAAKAPCPWLNIMPTGGVKPEEENLKGWFSSGASCVGMGSQLFVKDRDGNFEYDEITSKVKFSLTKAGVGN